jgi:transcription-repair coupling factor (superfamily II helicase)
MDDTQKINSEDIKWLNIKSVKNLFDLIKLRILASNYKVRSIKKVWINYQIDFEEDTTIEQLKRFLILDNDVKFSVVTPKKLRSSIKNFTSEEKFVKYLLSIFETKDKIRKIRLNKKTKSLKI